MRTKAKTLKKVIFSIEKLIIFIEKTIISIKKLNISIEKVTISIKNLNISIEKMKKLTVFEPFLRTIFFYKPSSLIYLPRISRANDNYGIIGGSQCR